jgi:hypothetical protein
LLEGLEFSPNDNSLSASLLDLGLRGYRLKEREIYHFPSPHSLGCRILIDIWSFQLNAMRLSDGKLVNDGLHIQVIQVRRKLREVIVDKLLIAYSPKLLKCQA